MNTRREDPWEFEHAANRLQRHERSWVQMIREDGLPDRDGTQPDYIPPTTVEVCPQCGGRGRSSLYLGTFSGDQLAEDPDFADEYRSGGYDRTCDTCNGRNVVEIVDRDQLDDELRAHFDRWMADAHDTDAIERQEWMMGA